jgi:hypothetical protein
MNQAEENLMKEAMLLTESISSLKARLEAVTEERDFLRALLKKEQPNDN